MFVGLFCNMLCIDFLSHFGWLVKRGKLAYFGIMNERISLHGHVLMGSWSS